MKFRRFLAAIGAMLFLAACLTACTKKPDSVLSVKDLSVIHEPEFGGVYLTMTIDDFNAQGSVTAIPSKSNSRTAIRWTISPISAATM